MIDTHAHLDVRQFDKDRKQVIENALSRGVDKIINVGCDLRSSQRSIQLAEEYEEIFATVGFHPHDARDLTDRSLGELEKLSAHRKAVAIGEIGLDFYRNLSPRDDQVKAFEKQIALAKNLRLPVVVHVRQAWDDAIRILRETNASSVGGVLHSFSGSLEQARMGLNLGFCLSFNGMLINPMSKTPQVARQISPDSIVVETDSPYLSPLPQKDRRNQPAYIEHVVEKLATLLSPLTFEDVERITTVNASRLFGLGEFAPQIAYPIRDSLYLNITNRCSNACSFCVRNFTDFVKGHNLRLDREPSYREIINSLDDIEQYKEVVFCGYGEPTVRLDLLKDVARYLKNGQMTVRLNTNGQGNLINKRNIVPELVGLVDVVSISLNVENSERYDDLCRSEFGEGTFQKVIDFARECRKHLPATIVTVLDMPEVDLKKCERIARELGVELRVRHYNSVG